VVFAKKLAEARRVREERALTRDTIKLVPDGGRERGATITSGAKNPNGMCRRSPEVVFGRIPRHRHAMSGVAFRRRTRVGAAAPDLPLRQFVLTVPFELRARLAYDGALSA